MSNGVLTKSYSGTDFKIRAFVDIRSVLPYGETLESLQGLLGLTDVAMYDKFSIREPKQVKEAIRKLISQDLIVEFGNVQTIATSMAASTSAIMNVGKTVADGITRGQQTYAGSLVFILLDHEPLRDLKILSTLFNRTTTDEFSSVATLPKFSIFMEGSNEILSEPVKGLLSGSTIHKLVHDITLMQFGETVSVDDFYTEQVYQFTCRWVSDWIPGAFKYVPYVQQDNGIDMLAMGGVIDRLPLPDFSKIANNQLEHGTGPNVNNQGVARINTKTGDLNVLEARVNEITLAQ